MTDSIDTSILNECDLTTGIPPLLQEEGYPHTWELLREVCEHTARYLQIKRNHVWCGTSGTQLLLSVKESLMRKRNELLNMLQ